jgi:sugar phosphate isomerase/epimerase
VLHDFSRLCIHTMTTRPWSLQEAIRGYVRATVPGITVWRQHLEPQGAKESAKMLRDAELQVVSLCRGGFFPGKSKAERQEAVDDNKRAIDQAAEIGAPLVVLVCGAVPGIPLADARLQILDGIAAVLPHAEACGVRLSIEPLHPMFADSRSAVNTLRTANDMVARLDSPWVGVTVDVYHVWWDPDLEAEIRRAGTSIFSFHVCDWRTPTRDLLNDRGLMGEGCINIPQIRGWVEEAGFTGWIEVEIFSNEYWAKDQEAFLDEIKKAYQAYC